MKANVQKMMREWNMVSPGDNLLAAVSGGADSVCLLLVLQELRESMDFSLEAIHVEHGIRGEDSLEDQRFVQDLCARLGVPLTCEAVDVPALCQAEGLSEEEAARRLRYEVFSKVAQQKHAKVVLAHHLEDNAETVLFHMIRGSRMTGMCGMQPVRTDERGVVYLRPMLEIHRRDIEGELQGRGQEFCTDCTNSQLQYSRNYMRMEVVPRLEEMNSRAVEHINEMSWHLWEVQDFLNEEVRRARAELVQSQGILSELDIPKFMALHTAIRKELLMDVAASVAGSRKDITATHVAAMLQLCEKQSGKEVHLPYGVVAKREFDKLLICRESRVDTDASHGFVKEVAGRVSEVRVTAEDLESACESGAPYEVKLGESGESLCIKVFSYDAGKMEIPKKTYTKWMDYDKVRQGFCIRNRRQGDYFIGDAKGSRKKLQNYFVDEKIPQKQREEMWLLARENYVLWLVGGRMSEDIKVTETTNVIVELEYIGG